MQNSLKFALMALLLAVACASPPVENAPASTEATAITVAAVPTSSPAVKPNAEVTAGPTQPQAAPTAILEAVAENTQPAATKVPRLSLQATDPATVSLASGKVQLIEFFAFW
jgi:hypothetical protein